MRAYKSQKRKAQHKSHMGENIFSISYTYKPLATPSTTLLTSKQVNYIYLFFKLFKVILLMPFSQVTNVCTTSVDDAPWTTFVDDAPWTTFVDDAPWTTFVDDASWCFMVHADSKRIWSECCNEIKILEKMIIKRKTF